MKQLKNLNKNNREQHLYVKFVKFHKKSWTSMTEFGSNFIISVALVL